jgi:hypothetical protein
MKPIRANLIIGLSISVLITSCASNPATLGDSFVSPSMYNSYDCEQISIEMMSYTAEVSKLEGHQMKLYSSDQMRGWVGTLGLYPVLLLIEGDGAVASQLKTAKGTLKVLQQKNAELKCKSILFADTLTFNNGVTIEGKLVKYDEAYLIFKVDEESMKDIPNEAVINIVGEIVDENQVVFNNKFVKNITENNIIVAIPEEERRNKGFETEEERRNKGFETEEERRNGTNNIIKIITLGCGALIGFFIYVMSSLPF